MIRVRVITFSLSLAALVFASSASASSRPAEESIRSEGQIAPAVIQRFEDARREGLTKILLGMEITGAPEERKATITRELDRLGGLDPVVGLQLATEIVAAASTWN